MNAAWVRTHGNRIGFAILFLGMFVGLFRTEQIANQDQRNAKQAYIYACTTSNQHREITDETDDALADFIEKVLPLVRDPDDRQLFRELLDRLRAPKPRLDCTFPPTAKARSAN